MVTLGFAGGAVVNTRRIVVGTTTGTRMARRPGIVVELLDDRRVVGVRRGDVTRGRTTFELGTTGVFVA